MRLTTIAAVASTLALAHAAPALATTRLVDDDGVQCPKAQYTTIQAAVDAASPGDFISICDGRYPENVDVRTKNLVLHGMGFQRAIVHSITVDSTGVQILRLRVQGQGSATPAGIEVPNGMQAASIRDNLVRHVQTGIDVDESNAPDIRHNTVEDFTSAGILGSAGGGINSGVGSARAFDNTITGGGPGAIGIEFTQGGFEWGVDFSGLISGNHVSDADTGILVNSVDVDVKSNDVYGDGIGIHLIGPGDRQLLVSGNTVQADDDQGILADRSSAHFRVQDNDARGNGGLDCEDDSLPSGPDGPPDVWVHDKGLDAAPTSICTKTGR